jgi:acetyltransferase-like isoleucine patch superfamily enzyme
LDGVRNYELLPLLFCGRESFCVGGFSFIFGRRKLDRVYLYKSIVGKPRIPKDTPQDQLDRYAWVEPPFHADYGTNIHLGENVFINFHCTMVDTCRVAIGSRTLLGPSISLYAGTHPLDPWLRDGTRGPEGGAPITIGEDCWLGGCCIVLPGVTIGNGSVVGAGSVVTKVFFFLFSLFVAGRGC